MKLFKRIGLFSFLLVFIFVVFAFVKVNTKADSVTTSDKITYRGAQIRTSDPAGIRFVSQIDLTGMGLEASDILVYGTLVGLGTGNIEDLIVNSVSFNGKSIINIQADRLADSENGYFYGSITGFVESLYDKDLTVRSYIKKTDDTYIYSSTSMVKTLAEGVTSAINNGVSTELITSVGTYLSNNYCVVNNTLNDFNQLTTRQLNMKKYSFSNLNELYADFINDLNVTGLTTSSNLEDFNNYLKIGTSWVGLEPSNHRLVRLFDGVGLAKWSWLLDYLSTFGNDQVSRQAYSLLHTRQGGSNYYEFNNLIVSLWNFFHTTSEEVTVSVGTSIKFGSVDDYSTCPWPQAENIKDSNVKKIGESFKLPAGVDRVHYDCNGYSDGSLVTSANSNYTISNVNTKFELSYSLHNYTIKYYNDSQELTTIASTYTYNSSSSKALAANPGVTKVGYAFVGWHLEKDLSDDVVTSIPAGSDENKVFYAEWQLLTPETLNLSERDVSVLNQITPDIIIKDGLNMANYTLSGEGLNASYSGKMYQWNENIFDDITDASSKITDGMTVYFAAGTYSGGYITIKKSNVNYIGPFYNSPITNSTSRGEEAIINAGLNLNASNIVVNGLSFGQYGGIKFNGSKNSSALYCRFFSNAPSSNFSKQISSLGTYTSKIYLYNTNTINISNCSFNFVYSTTCAGIMTALNYYANDIVINNNYFTVNKYPESEGNYSPINLDYAAGNCEINNNVFNLFPSYYNIYINSTYFTKNDVIKSLDTINIINNSFKKSKYATAGTTPNIYFGNLRAGQTVNVIKNTFAETDSDYSKIMEFKSATGGACNILYNIINGKFFARTNTEYKNVSTIINYNYIPVYHTTSGNVSSQDNAFDSIEELENSYNTEYTIKYYDGVNELSEIEDTFKFSISTKKLALKPGIVKAGKTFVGWHLDSNLIDAIITDIPALTKQNIVLYAEWANTTTVNYALSSAEVAIINRITPNIIVIPNLEEHNYVLTGEGLDSKYGSIEYVWGENAFARASDAFNAANANNKIYFAPGTHTGNDVTINTSGLFIYSLNYDNEITKNEARSNEAIIEFNIEITVEIFNAYGLSFGNNGGIKVSSFSTPSFAYCRFYGEAPEANHEYLTNNYGKIFLNNGPGPYIEYCSFASSVNGSKKNIAILSTVNLTDVYICDSYFTNTSVDSVLIREAVESIVLSSVTSDITIDSNVFDVKTSTRVIYIKSTKYSTEYLNNLEFEWNTFNYSYTNGSNALVFINLFTIEGTSVSVSRNTFNETEYASSNIKAINFNGAANNVSTGNISISNNNFNIKLFDEQSDYGTVSVTFSNNTVKEWADGAYHKPQE